MSRAKYLRLLISRNLIDIITYIIAVILAYWFSYSLPILSPMDVRLLLTLSGTMLALTMATIVFYARFLDEKVDWLFKTLPWLEKKYPKVDFRKPAEKIFLCSIFAYLILLIIAVLLVVTLLSSVYIIFSNQLQYVAAVISIFMVTIGMLLIWIVSFVISTTPARTTLNALIKTDN